MNYFAHGRMFVDDPYFVAGTALPDWLSVVDRGVRVRGKHAEPFHAHDDTRLASLARGLSQHHADDGWFHETRAFHELCWAFAHRLREAYPDDDSHRPGFLAHILIEVLLDDALIAAEPERIDTYYAGLATVDAEWVESAVEQLGPRRPQKLAWFIGRFVEVRFLLDYADDERLRFRMNQVLGRVGLPALDETFRSIAPELRAQVADRRVELLTP